MQKRVKCIRGGREVLSTCDHSVELLCPGAVYHRGPGAAVEQKSAAAIVVHAPCLRVAERHLFGNRALAWADPGSLIQQSGSPVPRGLVADGSAA